MALSPPARDAETRTAASPRLENRVENAPTPLPLSVSARKDGDLSRDHAGTDKNMETARANMETGRANMETDRAKNATGKEKVETGSAKNASARAKMESPGAAPTLRRCPTPRKPQNAQLHTAQPYRNLPEKPLDIGGVGVHWAIVV